MDVEPLDLDDLACFLAVAEQLHFRRAARIVGLSPGALSQRIRHLEDGLDVPVFQRSTRSVELTAAGRRRLQAQIDSWTRHARLVGRLLSAES